MPASVSHRPSAPTQPALGQHSASRTSTRTGTRTSTRTGRRSPLSSAVPMVAAAAVLLSGLGLAAAPASAGMQPSAGTAAGTAVVTTPVTAPVTAAAPQSAQAARQATRPAARRSAARSALLWETVSYGPDPAQAYDVYRPAHSAGKRRPTLLLIHGGGWVMGDKADMRQTAEYFTAAGWVTISVNYRLLSAKVKLDDTVSDVSAALDHVRANAASLGVDRNRVVAMGGSAGGHLAMTLGTLGTGTDRLRCVVASAGMPALWTQNATWSYRQGKARLLVARSSPQRGLSAREWYGRVDPYTNAGAKDAPLLWLGANRDTYVHPDLPWKMASKLRSAGVPASVVVADDVAHGLFAWNYPHRDAARLLTLQWMRNRVHGTAMPPRYTSMRLTASRTGSTAEVTVRAWTNELPDSAPYSVEYTAYRARPGTYQYTKVRTGRLGSGLVRGVSNQATVTFTVPGVARAARIKVSLRDNGHPSLGAVVLR